jgi:hypothetical protein
MVGPDVWETCRELITAGSVFAFLAEHREALFPAEFFADMYPSANGRPSLPPQVLAATVVLQSLTGLSDFETVQELRCDLRWKAAGGLGLNDTGFDPSLLTYFRRRLSRSADPMRIFSSGGIGPLRFARSVRWTPLCRPALNWRPVRLGPGQPADGASLGPGWGRKGSETQ